MKIKTTLVFLLTAFSASAKMPFSIGSIGNKVTGKLVHSWRNSFYKYADAQLKPENEKKIRSIAEKMGIAPDELKIYANPSSAGPHCIGDRLYFDDDWFDKWADSPVKKFIIAHELSHLKKCHFPKLVAFFSFNVGVWFYTTYRIWRYNFNNSDKGTSNDLKTAAYYASFCKNIMCSCFFSYLYTKMQGSVFSVLAFAQSRSYESEADALALEHCGPLSDNSMLAQGLGKELTKSAYDFRQHSFCEKLYARHPHPKDRLKNLNMPLDVSRQAGEEMLEILKERIIAHLCWILDPAGPSKKWRLVVPVARLCSVYDSVAQDYVKKLACIPDLFSVLVESIKTKSFNYTVLEKEFTREDIDRLEKLACTANINDGEVNNRIRFININVDECTKILQGTHSINRDTF